MLDRTVARLGLAASALFLVLITVPATAETVAAYRIGFSCSWSRVGGGAHGQRSVEVVIADHSDNGHYQIDELPALSFEVSAARDEMGIHLLHRLVCPGVETVAADPSEVVLQRGSPGPLFHYSVGDLRLVVQVRSLAVGRMTQPPSVTDATPPPPVRTACVRCAGKGACRACAGKGSRACSLCWGSGNCVRCAGSGDCHLCHGSGVGACGGKCPQCGGKGSCHACHKGHCAACGGDGAIVCSVCRGSGSCYACRGRG